MLFFGYHRHFAIYDPRVGTTAIPFEEGTSMSSLLQQLAANAQFNLANTAVLAGYLVGKQ